ncbi:MAG: hypothetical protein BGO43_12025 [Gammaproteobacteria bacterium 39-13]|nr:succinate dehydrogenase assembly factor 2 [Gammaproteobacteria bacterium]OJV85345.1 MAG: hypothetical protein BGO43_12025 [Gammaproteobacteria bacterium 39-13]
MVENKTAERIRWACRRGMLELDLFLVPFYEHCYISLSEVEKKVFSELLTATDPELLSWLMAHNAPENEEVALIVNKIRQYRLSGPHTPL